MSGEAVANDEQRCPTCAQVVPALTFCVRCGSRLEAAPGRRAFAALPGERTLTPRIASTLFPRLPKASLGAFKLALALSVAAVTGLALAGAHPVAIIVAAVSVPVLVLVYLYDVDVYEDEPLLVIGLTAGWGAAMGAAVAFLGLTLTPSAADLLSQSRSETVLQQGVLIPLIALALGLAGPLVLLPYQRFNDVLDGATFGAASAVWLSATQLLVLSSSLFDEGVRPTSSSGTWTLRLLQLAVCMPLLWAGVGGAVAGSFWFRYRGHVGSRPIAAVGRPFISIAVGAAMVVAAASAQVVLPLPAAVVVSLVLAACALVWLRALIHAGLLEESLGIEIGPEIECANCARRTPRHTFCGGCGIALQALPKQAASVGQGGFRSGEAPARLRDRAVLGTFGTLLGLLALGAVGVLTLRAPDAPPPSCPPGEPCGGPPSSVERLVVGTSWRSSGGERLEFAEETWQLEHSIGEKLTLRSGDDIRIDVQVEQSDKDPSSDPNAFGRLPTWVRAPRPIELPIPHGPNVGYVNGVGSWHEGFVDSPQGPREAVTVATLASRRLGRIVTATVVFFAPASRLFSNGLRSRVDTVLNTITWPAAPDPSSPSANSPTGAPGESAEAVAAPLRGLLPHDVATAYGINQLWERGIKGKGESVAIISLDSFRDSDVAAFDRLAGITGAPPVERVLVDGSPVPVGSGAVEVNLDIDVIRGIAPEAKIINYEATRSWPAFVAAFKRVNDDNRASIVSVSWGFCLAHLEADVREAMQIELARAADAGRTVFVASGDAGAFSCLHNADELDPNKHVETVDWPAASPSVVAVGGTRLSVRRDGTYYSEDGWEDTLSNDGTGGGVLSGTSKVYQRPDWQRGPGVQNAFSNGNRQVPDVAGPADCDSAFFVVYSDADDPLTTPIPGPHGCGTSAAAPFWAGVTALVSQYARQQGRKRIGFIAPVLYEIARSKTHRAAFHDVQTGGNLKHDAGPGWDYATGLGSPHAWNLARAIVARLR